MSEKDNEEADKTDDTWSNNSKVSAVLKLKLRDTAESSALCSILRWNQSVSLSDLYDLNDDVYKDTIIFWYISSEKLPWIHHPHNNEAKAHRKKSDAVLHWIDMIENGQSNLLFIDMKRGYMKLTAVDTQGRNMWEMIFEIVKAFYTEVYSRFYTFELHVNLYKMRASLFICWHLSDPLTATSGRKYLQSVATERIITSFNQGKKETDWVNSVSEVLITINDQLHTARETHRELKEYLMYWRYIMTEKVEVTEEVTEDDINQTDRLTFTSTIS